MKIIHLFLMSSLLFVLSCGTITKATNSSDALKNQWVLQNEDTDEIGLNQEPITISFGLEKVNEISGFAGCNFYGGKFFKNENEISFQDIYSTKRACPDLETETEFLNLLNDVDNFIIKGNNLYLYKGKLLYLHFKK